MKKTRFIQLMVSAALIAVIFSSTLVAQDESKQDKNQIKNQVKSELKVQTKTQNKEHSNRFVDANADGYNDNAPDSDGDGIPNGRDEDYTGAKFRKNGKGFVDLNGDGLNDNAFDSDGDGVPNGQDPDFVRPEDGTGRKMMKGKNNQTKFGGNKYGPGNGTGICNGSGPKGNRGGR